MDPQESSGADSVNILPVDTKINRQVMQVIFVGMKENVVCLLNI